MKLSIPVISYMNVEVEAETAQEAMEMITNGEFEECSYDDDGIALSEMVRWYSDKIGYDDVLVMDEVNGDWNTHEVEGF